MVTRVLPPAEWGRLAGTELETVHASLPQGDDVRILVVEDEAGAIIGCWAALRVVHVEGIWIAPAYRSKTAVARALWRGMARTVATAFQAGGAWTASLSPQLDRLLTRHATPVPGTHYLIRLGG